VLELEVLMRTAIDLAQSAQLRSNDVPVGALLIDEENNIIAQAGNEREAKHDPTAHAEVLVLRQAALIKQNWRLNGCTLIVTLEPCVMCAGAIINSRISRVVFGAWDEKAGACGSLFDLVRDRRLNHQVEVVGGVLEDECAAQLRTFFADHRDW
jgi:tRNA(adenine34) deaminase